jgi:hypothetical protein
MANPEASAREVTATEAQTTHPTTHRKAPNRKKELDPFLTLNEAPRGKNAESLSDNGSEESFLTKVNAAKLGRTP